jgi:hypothetical protein
MLKRIFGPKRVEVMGMLRGLHNEAPHNLYSSEIMIRMIKSRRMIDMGKKYSTNGKKRNAYRILVEKPKVRRPIGRPRCSWVDNVKVYLRSYEVISFSEELS